MDSEDNNQTRTSYSSSNSSTSMDGSVDHPLIQTLINHQKLSSEKFCLLKPDQKIKVQDGFMLVYEQKIEIDQLCELPREQISQLSSIHDLIGPDCLSLDQALFLVQNVSEYALSKLENPLVSGLVKDGKLELEQAYTLTLSEIEKLEAGCILFSEGWISFNELPEYTVSELERLDELEPLLSHNCLSIATARLLPIKDQKRLQNPTIQSLMIDHDFSIEKVSTMSKPDLNRIKSYYHLINNRQIDVDDLLQASDEQLTRFLNIQAIIANYIQPNSAVMNQLKTQDVLAVNLVAQMALKMINEWPDYADRKDITLFNTFKCAYFMMTYNEQTSPFRLTLSLLWGDDLQLEASMLQTVYNQSAQTHINDAYYFANQHDFWQYLAGDKPSPPDTEWPSLSIN